MQERGDPKTILTRLLGNYPLALSQATRHIKNTKCSITEYIDLFTSIDDIDTVDMMNDPPEDYHETVRSTWKVTLRYIKKEHPIRGKCAENILLKLAHLESSYAVGFKDMEKLMLRDKECNKDMFSNAMKFLMDFSLIEFVPIAKPSIKNEAASEKVNTINVIYLHPVFKWAIQEEAKNDATDVSECNDEYWKRYLLAFVLIALTLFALDYTALGIFGRKS